MRPTEAVAQIAILAGIVGARTDPLRTADGLLPGREGTRSSALFVWEELGQHGPPDGSETQDST